MTTTELAAALDAQLTDAHVLAAVRHYLTAIEYRTEYDGEIVTFAADVQIQIVDKALVLDRRDGARLTAQVAFDPVLRDGRYTGLSHGGTLKIIFGLAGEYQDEVYSRNNVIPRD